MRWLGSLVESWHKETWVAAQAIAENSARIAPHCGPAEAGSVKSDSSDARLMPSVVGCAIRMMPTKPTATADQRRMPTCSLSIGIERMVTKIGEARAMQIALGNGISFNAR